MSLVVRLLFAGGLAALLAVGPARPAQAHRDGCHRWHSCPSDSGSYVCGDAGYECRYPTYPESQKGAVPDPVYSPPTARYAPPTTNYAPPRTSYSVPASRSYPTYPPMTLPPDYVARAEEAYSGAYQRLTAPTTVRAAASTSRPAHTTVAPVSSPLAATSSSTDSGSSDRSGVGWLFAGGGLVVFVVLRSRKKPVSARTDG